MIIRRSITLFKQKPLKNYSVFLRYRLSDFIFLFPAAGDAVLIVRYLFAAGPAIRADDLLTPDIKAVQAL